MAQRQLFSCQQIDSVKAKIAHISREPLLCRHRALILKKLMLYEERVMETKQELGMKNTDISTFRKDTKPFTTR